MDSVISSYHSVVEQLLQEYADLLDNHEQVKVELVFDKQRALF